MKAIAIVSMLVLVLVSAGYAQTINTYNVTGRSADELIESMRSSSPQGFWAHTRNRWKYNYKYYHVDGRYELGEVSVTRTVEITMPQWTDYSYASACQQQSWDAMYSSLRRHEDIHVAIADPVSAELKRAIEAVGPKSSATELESAIDEAANRVLEENKRAQASFDLDTNHGKSDPNDPVVLKACS
ncbi:MAG: DUF922 domain-containing protein [Granulosicoccus sp.]